VRDDTEQLIKDFEKVCMAGYKAPEGKHREEMEKALREVWEERRREKANKEQEDKSKK